MYLPTPLQGNKSGRNGLIAATGEEALYIANSGKVACGANDNGAVYGWIDDSGSYAVERLFEQVTQERTHPQTQKEFVNTFDDYLKKIR
jgi:hypothetical protein